MSRLEITYVATLYMMHAIMTRALRLEWDDVDERITEVFVEGAEDVGVHVHRDR